MSDDAVIGARPGVRFDMTINLGHVLTGATFLVTATFGFVTMDARISKTDDNLRRIETKELVGIEARLLQRINDDRATADRAQIRVADDIRDVKVLLGRIEDKIDRKADKPVGR